MRPGTPGFIGARLRSAREARGLTAVALASLLEVTPAAVSQYEKGVQSPAPAVMRRIFEVLNLPMQHFLRPAHSSGAEVIFYRSLSSATKLARTRAEQRYEWLREIVAYLDGYLELPTVSVPNFDVPMPTKLTDDLIEGFANEVRVAWGLGDGPISNVVWLLEKQGIVVGRYEFADERLDAFSEWRSIDGRPYVVLNADKKCAARSRFDAAHELGHLVLHRSVDQKILNRGTDFSTVEGHAHRFAAAFLFPESAFRREVYTVSLDLFRSLKMKWRTSIGMMLMRARHLGMVSEEADRRFWLNYGRRGWRKQEPLDDCLEPEEPALLRRSVELLLTQGVVTRHDLEFGTGLHVRDIAELTQTPLKSLDMTKPPERENQPAVIPIHRHDGRSPRP